MTAGGSCYSESDRGTLETISVWGVGLGFRDQGPSALNPVNQKPRVPDIGPFHCKCSRLFNNLKPWIQTRMGLGLMFRILGWWTTEKMDTSTTKKHHWPCICSSLGPGWLKTLSPSICIRHAQLAPPFRLVTQAQALPASTSTTAHPKPRHQQCPPNPQSFRPSSAMSSKPEP